jgi:hypothetical protein
MTSDRPPVPLEITPSRPGDVRERQRQRAARRQEASDRKGRDEQRLRRAGGQAYLVLPDRATADEVMREIAATPVIPDGLAWPVQMWDDDVGAAIGAFEAEDGRVAVGHPWTSAERAWLAGYLEGWHAVAIVDALPADWKAKVENELSTRRG